MDLIGINGRFFSEEPNPDGEKSVRERFSLVFEKLSEQGVDPREIDEVALKLETGRVIAVDLLDPSISIPKSTKKRALALTWFLMGCAYRENNGIFLRGSVRLYNLSVAQSKRFKQFYASCSEAGVHNRPSSHFRELTVGHQKGVDFGKGTLPFDKDLGTLLCGRLSDGGFFIKLEREPLSLLNLVGSVKHLYNWASHIRSGGGEKTVGGVSTRRETDGVDKARKSFRNIMAVADELGIKESKSSLEKYDRIFEMHRVVTKIADLVKEKEPLLVDGSIERNEEVDESIGEFKEKCSSIESSLEYFLERFDESIADIKHPSKACGSEVFVDLNDYIKD